MWLLHGAHQKHLALLAAAGGQARGAPPFELGECVEAGAAGSEAASGVWNQPKEDGEEGLNY